MADTDERQAGDEIQVTEEMIEAGVAAFVAYDDRFDDRDKAVRRIFSAMALKAGQPAVARAFGARDSFARS